MIALKALTELFPEQLDLFPETDRGELLKAARFVYEAVGEIAYGIVGVVAPSMTAREAIVWFLPYPNIRPSWSERRAAKQFNLTEAIGYIPVAEVHVDDIPAMKFAQFFGMKKQYVRGDFYLYVGETQC